MREEISAGGVVLFGNAILLLRKFNGDWVLPKGRIEAGEQKKEAALRLTGCATIADIDERVIFNG